MAIRSDVPPRNDSAYDALSRHTPSSGNALAIGEESDGGQAVGMTLGAGALGSGSRPAAKRC